MASDARQLPRLKPNPIVISIHDRFHGGVRQMNCIPSTPQDEYHRIILREMFKAKQRVRECYPYAWTISGDWPVVSGYHNEEDGDATTT